MARQQRNIILQTIRWWYSSYIWQKQNKRTSNITSNQQQRWAWSIGGMILTGETKLLGRKTLYSVGGRWMSMEHWWNDTDRGNWSAGRETCPSATLSTTNSTWTEVVSNPGLSDLNTNIKSDTITITFNSKCLQRKITQ